MFTPACTDPQQTRQDPHFAGCPEQSGEKVNLIHGHKTTAGCELSTVDLVGHRRRPECVLWRQKQVRSDAAEVRLSVRAIIDCDYSTVIFNDTRHHDEYMRTTTTTLKAGLLASGQAESTNQIPSRPSSRLQRRGQSGGWRVTFNGCRSLTGVACTQAAIRLAGAYAGTVYMTPACRAWMLVNRMRLSDWRETMWTLSEPVRILGGLHQARKQAIAARKKLWAKPKNPTKVVQAELRRAAIRKQAHPQRLPGYILGFIFRESASKHDNQNLAERLHGETPELANKSLFLRPNECLSL
ncbi:hypothetical protein B0H14DRAFT_2567121 [Mycena olivaceomarginata]|nr:hypothetical protein B0H14DRAFT_2567121 [Mycena olivaceomarginata]